MTSCRPYGMPTSGSPRHLLVDTSVAVPLLLVDHVHHAAAARALRGERLGLAGHAAFETFSVLSRLPRPMRKSPGAIEELFAQRFPASRFLGAVATRDLLIKFAKLGIAGGAVYDALVGAVAIEHGLPLITRDRRAAETYRKLEAIVRLLG